MPNPKRPLRRRTRETVSRLRLTVLTTPQSATSVESDLVLVRAALLYADQVELVSPAAQMLVSLESYGLGGSKDALSLFASLDDETMLRFGLSTAELQVWRSYQSLLKLPPAAQQKRLGPTAYSEFRRIVDGLRVQMASTNDDLRRTVRDTLEESGYTEFASAIKLGLLRLGDSRMVDGSSMGQSVGSALASDHGEKYEGSKTDEEVRLYTEQLSRMVTDRSRMVLLDSGARSLVDAMVTEGVISPSLQAKLRSQEALLGTGFLTRLPTFDNAKTDELLDLRREFVGPLIRYREAVGRMRERLSSPYGPEVAEEIEFIHRTEVEPALLEVREGFVDHSWVRDTLRLNARDLVSFAAGSFGGGQLVQRLGEVSDLSVALLTGLGAAAGGAAGFTSGAVRTAEARRELRRRDFFYLYEADRRMRG